MSEPGTPVVETQFFDLPDEVLPFKMRSGDLLPAVRLAYEIHGEISPERDNVVLLFHALTGSQHVAGFTPSVEGVGRWVEENQTGWWEGFVGPGLGVDTDRFAGGLRQLPGWLLRDHRTGVDRSPHR